MKAVWFKPYKFTLCVTLIGVVALTSQAWACDKPQVSGYDDVSCLHEGLAKVKKSGKYGFVDKTGQVTIPVQYDDAWSFREGLTWVKKNGKWGFIDKTGKVVIPIQYDYASSFKNGKAEVRLNSMAVYFYIDKTGKRIY